MTDPPETSARPAASGGADSDQSVSPWSSGSGAVFAATPAPAFDVAEPTATEPNATEATAEESVTEESVTTSRTAPRVVADGPVITLSLRRSGPGRRIVVVAAIGVAVAVLAAAVAIVIRAVLTDDLAVDIATESTGSNDTDVGDSGESVVTSGDIVVPLVTESFAGADRRRLPGQLDERWRVDVAGVSASDRTRLSVLDDGAVIAVFGDGPVQEGSVQEGSVQDGSVQDGRAASVVALLEGVDGSERWRTEFDVEAQAFTVLGSVRDVIVLERLDPDRRTVLGLSVDTGEVLWVRDTDDLGVHVVLEGTPLVARVSLAPNAGVTFIDPASGDEVGRVPGGLLATDHLGTWYVRNGRTVSKLELGDGWNPPTPFDTLWVDDDEPATVVGGRLIAIDDGTLEVRGNDGSPTRVATPGVGSGDFAARDTGASFTQLLPMVADSFVVVGSRSVFGAELDENGDAEVRWRESGTPIESRPTERGLSLLMASDGGGTQWVIDASTGREIAIVEIVAGSLDILQLVGNGVVLRQSALVGFERVGLDLDGNRLWSLVGDGPLAIGSGVVVTYAPSDSGVAVTAYGDPAP